MAKPRGPKRPTARSRRRGSKSARTATGSSAKTAGGAGRRDDRTLEAHTDALASHVPIVGVGASAGGLESFSQLLRALPAEPGIALVLVQHLAPHHESALQGLLSTQSRMPVVEASNGLAIEANHVYVIPPNVQMCLTDGHLRLVPRPTDRTQYTPVNVFLRSLAETAQEQAIGVILSGTASDGAAGIRDVKGMGGITIAQTPESARYDGMPRAAIATGAVDLVLAPAEIASELVRIASQKHEYARATVTAPPDSPPPPDGGLERIFALLRAETGVDFKQYKIPTLQRRIHRRMILHRLARIDQYVAFLEQNRSEVQALYHDIFIHVTRFFREPESFEVLASEVLPKILATRHGDEPIRVWVAGCATGEEAYSVAIILLEVLGQAGSVPLQIFATDISDSAIERARSGSYPATIAADVSAARLRRFFTKSDGGYRVAKSIRDACIFSRHDLTRDPPFSKLDLILCRNVLIYLGLALQKRLLGMFRYALKPMGYLMLAHSETVGAYEHAFATVDKKHRIYQRKTTGMPALDFTAGYFRPAAAAAKVATPPPPEAVTRSLHTEATRILQERFAPPGVIVDAEFQIIQFRGHTGPFLEPAPGDPSLSVLKMAREGLLDGLRTVLTQARKSRRAARKSGLRLRDGGGSRKIDVEAIPIELGGNHHYLVLFDDAATRSRRTREAGAPARARGNVARLAEELASSREYLQSLIQDLEAANEELQSANEEVLSSNEELQSTNEELDTAKEELQSTNEELNTVNEELNARNEELSGLNSDLVNLLGSVHIAIIIVSSDLRIRRFTPMAERVLNLIPGDVGRPIGHIKPNVDCPELENLITEVIDTVTVRERQVVDRQGKRLLLRIRPYKNVENRIDGAIVALFDIDSTKDDTEELRIASSYADALVRSVREPVVVLDDTHRVRLVNRPFLDRFGLPRADVEQRRIYDIGDGRWDVPALHALLEQDVVANLVVADVTLTIHPVEHAASCLLVNGAHVPATAEHDARTVLTITDAPVPAANGGSRP